MPQFLKTRTFRIVAIIAVLFALYAVAGFVVAPKWVRSALLKDIPASLGVTPSVGEIHINPFLFQVTVDDFSLSGVGGAKLLGFKRLFVDFELSSIWRRAYSFGNIDIDAPFVNAAMASDGSLNLLELRPKTAPPAKPKDADEPLPAIRIGSFKVSQGTMTYEDRSRPDVFSARLEPINFELREFATGVEGGQFTFTGSSKLGERIEWHGHLSVQPVESDGEFRLNGLLVHTLWEYLEDRLNFVVKSGSVDLAATYKFSAGTGPGGNGAAAGENGPNLQVNVATVALSDLAIRPKDEDTDWINVPSLVVSGAAVDLAKRLAHVDTIAISGLRVTSWLEPDGSVNLLKLAAVPATAAAPVTGAAPAPKLTAAGGTAAASAPWQYDVSDFDLREASLSAEDRTLHPTVKVVLAPLALHLSGLSQDLTKPVRVVFDTRINEQGSLSLSGEAVPQPLTANMAVKLANVDLAVLQPYIAQHSSMTLLGGRLGIEGKAHYGAQKNMPATQFLGNIAVEKLHTVDNTLHVDFINWDRLDILGLNYTQGPDRLDIGQIVARKPYARVVIEPDQSLNVKRVLAPPGRGAGATTAVAPVTATAVPPAPAGHKQRAAAAQTAAAAKASPAMPMSIKKILVQAGQANFVDLSLTPNFSAGVHGLEGTVAGVSSKANSRATIDLQGAVDTYSPVSITGEFNVLGPRLYTDIAMSFRNMELTIFNPYSDKFAGYNITKGKLTTELKYKIDGRKLDAQHHIVVEQLEFGDKTASKNAVSLPVKLAVALLKDRNGVIDLSIPVTGSLDDPQFRLMPIIWKVLVNLLEKAVTAPFALLGSLFGGGPDIQFIDFQPGMSTLDGPATDKAKAVAKALIERPQLKIEVPIAVVPDLDRPALIAARFSEEVSAALAAKGGAKRNTGAPSAPREFDQLDPASQLDLLGRIYSRDLAADPKFPESITGLKSKSDVTAAKVDFLSKALHEHIQIGDADLQTLGKERALALQRSLLTDNDVDAERVFLVSNDKATADDGKVKLELSLK